MEPPKSNTNLLAPSSTANTIRLPTTMPQKLSSKSSGSATGNPRNKCALQPGHSLMDWIRLGNSGVDLTGNGGAMKPVSSVELAKHNTRSDAWMAIRGRVYNVTRYMDFHPGGVEELMRGVGTDATKLFDEVHAWVNYEQLLSKCLIGPLRGNVNVKLNANTTSTTTLSVDGTFQMPRLPTAVPTNGITPRFDWLQTRADLTFHFQTRQFCNPGCWLTAATENDLSAATTKSLQLHLLIAQTTTTYALELHAPLQWPPSKAAINSETGKITLCFAKAKAVLWPDYGTHTTSNEPPLEDRQHMQYVVASNCNVNHDSFALTLHSRQQTLMLLPIGYHVSITTADVKSASITRSYTPVPAAFMSTQHPPQQHHLSFLIKSYENGLLTPKLRALSVGDLLQLSAPKGGFELRQLLPHNRIALLAAGSGLTPMLALIEHLLQRSTNRIEKLLLMYFNKSAADIWCNDALTELQARDDRFQVTNILSQPDTTNTSTAWPGAIGRISAELLAPLTDRNAAAYVSYICLCGPSAFNQEATNILKCIKFHTDNMHIFQG